MASNCTAIKPESRKELLNVVASILHDVIHLENQAEEEQNRPGLAELRLVMASFKRHFTGEDIPPDGSSDGIWSDYVERLSDWCVDFVVKNS
jgi:hypothetical protein